MSKEEQTKKILKQKNSLVKAESAFSKLNEIERSIVYYYLQDDNNSLLRAIIEAGAAETMVEASMIAKALLESDKIKNAVAEIGQLQGITVSSIRDRLYDIAMDTEGRACDSISACKTLYEILTKNQPTEVTHTHVVREEAHKKDRKRISQGIDGVISSITGEILSELD